MDIDDDIPEYPELNLEDVSDDDFDLLGLNGGMNPVDIDFEDDDMVDDLDEALAVAGLHGLLDAIEPYPEMSESEPENENDAVNVSDSEDDCVVVGTKSAPGASCGSPTVTVDAEVTSKCIAATGLVQGSHQAQAEVPIEVPSEVTAKEPAQTIEPTAEVPSQVPPRVLEPAAKLVESAPIGSAKPNFLGEILSQADNCLPIQAYLQHRRKRVKQKSPQVTAHALVVNANAVSKCSNSNPASCSNSLPVKPAKRSRCSAVTPTMPNGKLVKVTHCEDNNISIFRVQAKDSAVGSKYVAIMCNQANHFKGSADSAKLFSEWCMARWSEGASKTELANAKVQLLSLGCVTIGEHEFALTSL